jgi:hypothetical protein
MVAAFIDQCVQILFNVQAEFGDFYSDSDEAMIRLTKVMKMNQHHPGRTERSVYGSKRIKYGIFTALRRVSFTKIRLRYIYKSVMEGLWTRY